MNAIAPAARLRVLILEDERHARNYLVELVERSGLARVHAAVSNAALATEALLTGEVDVAFVDVTLVGEQGATSNGLLWIEDVRARANAPRFVLTTASRDHALHAYQLGVTDYLLKPFVLDRVRESLERVRPQVPSRPPSGSVEEGRVVARKGRGLVFLHPDEAWAFEAEGRLCFVHSAEGRHTVDLSLSALEAVLGSGFVRAHRNWLVALRRVRELDRDELVVGDGHNARTLRILVARDRVAHVRERLLDSTVGLRRDD